MRPQALQPARPEARHRKDGDEARRLEVHPVRKVVVADDPAGMRAWMRADPGRARSLMARLARPRHAALTQALVADGVDRV